MESSRHQMEPARVTAPIGEQHPTALASEHPLAEEEPDDVRPAAGQATDTWHHQPRPAAEQTRLRGEAAYEIAQELEEQEGLSPRTVNAYKQAARSLINVTALGPIDSERREPVSADPIRLIMIATSLNKQAQADEVEPYSGEAYGPTGRWRNLDRRSYLRGVAYDNLKRASEMLLGADADTRWADEFDGDNPKEVVAAAAVEAALSIDTAEHKITPETIHEDTTELLENEGTAGVVKLMDRYAHRPGALGRRFITRMGEAVLEEALDSDQAQDHEQQSEDRELVAA